MSSLRERVEWMVASWSHEDMRGLAMEMPTAERPCSKFCRRCELAAALAADGQELHKEEPEREYLDGSPAWWREHPPNQDSGITFDADGFAYKLFPAALHKEGLSSKEMEELDATPAGRRSYRTGNLGAAHKEGAGGEPTTKQLLDFLDAEAAKWADEVKLAEIVKAITGDGAKVDAMLRQAFVEGGYRGACGAARERAQGPPPTVNQAVLNQGAMPPAGRAEQGATKEKTC